MSINEKHPLPWSIGPTYQHRVDVLDANGKTVALIKPPALETDVVERAQAFVDAVNGGIVAKARAIAAEGRSPELDKVLDAEVERVIAEGDPVEPPQQENPPNDDTEKHTNHKHGKRHKH